MGGKKGTELYRGYKLSSALLNPLGGLTRDCSRADSSSLLVPWRKQALADAPRNDMCWKL